MNILRFFVLSENGQLSVFGLSLPFFYPQSPSFYPFPLTFYLNKAPQPYLFYLKSASFSFPFYLKKKAPPPVTGKGTILRKIENRCV